MGQREGERVGGGGGTRGGKEVRQGEEVGKRGMVWGRMEMGHGGEDRAGEGGAIKGQTKTLHVILGVSYI